MIRVLRLTVCGLVNCLNKERQQTLDLGENLEFLSSDAFQASESICSARPSVSSASGVDVLLPDSKIEPSQSSTQSSTQSPIAASVPLAQPVSKIPAERKRADAERKRADAKRDDSFSTASGLKSSSPNIKPVQPPSPAVPSPFPTAVAPSAFSNTKLSMEEAKSVFVRSARTSSQVEGLTERAAKRRRQANNKKQSQAQAQRPLASDWFSA